MFIKGYTKSNNPGKLVINNEERFICAKHCGNRYYYVCACKTENKDKNVDKCPATANVITDDDENVIDVVLINKEHNHVLDESRVAKWKIQEDMDKEYIRDTTALPSTVRKKDYPEVSANV